MAAPSSSLNCPWVVGHPSLASAISGRVYRRRARTGRGGGENFKGRRDQSLCESRIEHFPAKWEPVRRRNCDRSRTPEHFPAKWEPVRRRKCDRSRTTRAFSGEACPRLDPGGNSCAAENATVEGQFERIQI